MERGARDVARHRTLRGQPRVPKYFKSLNLRGCLQEKSGPSHCVALDRWWRGRRKRHSFEIRRNFPIFQSLSLELELVSIFWKEEKRMRSGESKIPWIDIWNFILNSDDFRSIFEYWVSLSEDREKKKSMKFLKEIIFWKCKYLLSSWWLFKRF